MNAAEEPVVAFACDLIARPSVTPDDAGCMELICARLGRLGFTFERMDSLGVSNLWARRGDRAPLFCFAGHTDVVPPGPAEHWHSPPFEPTLRSGLLIGRGAADMKSAIAAFVVAVENFLSTCPEPLGSIALLLTSDEEGAATEGTVKVVEKLADRGEKIDYCIVGEPTSAHTFGDTIKNGRRGSLNGILTILGRQGHIAYPHVADNPILKLAPALAELAAAQWDEGDDYFPPTSWQVSNIRAGTGANNVIPGECELMFNFRFSPASPAETLKAQTHAILDKHGLNYRLQWQLSGNPFITGGGRLIEALGSSIQRYTGIRHALSTTGGTSDGRFIARICPEVVEFGPINASIHQIDEHVAVADLPRLSDIYAETLKTLLT